MVCDILFSVKLPLAAIVVAAVSHTACGNDTDSSDDESSKGGNPSGGSSGSGGTTATGGASGTTSGTGGAAGSGATSGSGGTGRILTCELQGALCWCDDVFEHSLLGCPGPVELL